MTTQKHKTSHVAEADAEGRVLVLCETCSWRDHVSVVGLNYGEALEAIFAARDAHEAEASKDAARAAR